MWNRLGLIAWWLLLGAAWIGCGPDVSLELPNGYLALVTSAQDSSIQPPDGVDGVGIGGWEEWIDGLDVQGDLLIGRLVDSSRDDVWPLLYYFVIDTSTHTLIKFDTEDAWLDGIEATGGSHELDLRSITPFFYSSGLILNIMVYGVGTLLVVWIVRRFRKAKREIESDGIGLV